MTVHHLDENRIQTIEELRRLADLIEQGELAAVFIAARHPDDSDHPTYQSGIWAASPDVSATFELCGYARSELNWISMQGLSVAGEEYDR